MAPVTNNRYEPKSDKENGYPFQSQSQMANQSTVGEIKKMGKQGPGKVLGMQQITEEFSTPAWDGNLQAQLNLAVRFLRNKIEKGLRAVQNIPCLEV